MTQAYEDALAEVKALHRFIAGWFQSGAKKSKPPTNARLSSVLFERVEGAEYLNWLHLHETKNDVL